MFSVHQEQLWWYSSGDREGEFPSNGVVRCTFGYVLRAVYVALLWVRACADRYIKEYEECYWHPRAVLLPDIPPVGCLSHTTLIIDKPTPILTTRQIGMSSNVNTRAPVVMDSSFTHHCRRSTPPFSRV